MKMGKFKIIKIKPIASDGRGYIADILNDESIKHVGIITCKAGSVRGKHYHKKQKQYTFVIKGKLKLVVKDLKAKTSKPKESIIKEMDIAEIPPYFYHSMEALDDSTILTLSSKSRSGNKFEDDTFRIKINSNN